jgi:endonuclease YncB( thermonuclease family)
MLSAKPHKTRLTAFLIFLICLACGTEQATKSPAAEKYPHYAAELVRLRRSQIQVDDGDTFSVGRLNIRILGIDTPEIAHPEHGFLKGQPYGREAARYAGKLLDQAEVIEYLPFREDSYGRLLAHVFVDGELFGVKMIEALLAYETVSFYGDNGFPDLARLIQRAAQHGKPPFMEPHKWRQIHRKRD